MYFRSLFARKTTESIIIGVTVLLMCHFSVADLPSVISKCHLDGNLEKCAEQIINRIRPNVASGDFGNGVKVPSLEPLLLNKLVINTPELNVTLRNLVVSGPSSYQVKSVKIDPAKLSFNIKTYTPLYSFTALYNIRLKLGLIDIQGEGDMKGDLMGLNIHLRVQMAKQGNIVKLQKVQNRVKIDKGRFNFNNLFNGDKVLSQVGNDLINNESPTLLKIVTPALEKQIREVHEHILSKLFKSVTYDELFL
ncbi:protein takeout-like [Culicoides brevitarsis]|uniref:protein takeout-like n=1 Tax=Culicoides brevitarsis TaxID=469753 RepID=UPI00307BC89C